MKRASILFVTVFVLGLPSLAMADFKRNHSSGNSCSTPNNYHQGNYNYGNYNSYGNQQVYHPRPSYYTNGSAWNNTSNRYNQTIQNGIRSGQLSYKEVRELREDQQDIREKEAAYRSDGYLSPRERASLQYEIKDFRGDLNHELNDGEHRTHR